MRRIIRWGQLRGVNAAVAVLVLAGVGGLFFLTWKSQFAAPPGYMFGTPTVAVEAGYCLAVTQGTRSITRGGAA